MAAILKECDIAKDTVTLLKKRHHQKCSQKDLNWRNNYFSLQLFLQSLLHFTGIEKVDICIMKNWLFSLGALQATKKERL